MPTFVEHVWDINPILDENSLVGQFLKSLFGYNGNPSLLEVIAYAFYLGIVGFLSLRTGGQPARLTDVRHSSPV